MADFHVVCQNDKLGWSAVIMGAKANDVNLSHSGRKIARKPGESKGSSRFGMDGNLRLLKIGNRIRFSQY
jgi:hypothetical protein